MRSLSIPFEWQEAVIRAAITLKLCNFEETGAIVAALTTSVPEAPDTQRNWDYRFCWLRDAYFVIQALNRLGTTRTMEDYLGYITNIVDDAESGSDQKDLPPLFGITRSPDLEERQATALPAIAAWARCGSATRRYTQIQNDVYGSVVLASTHAFLDRRMIRPGNRAAVRASRDARPARHRGLRPAGCGTVGAAHQGGGAHLLQRHVLGGLRPARQDRRRHGRGPTGPSSGDRRPTGCTR